jgi:hypothetical protein
LDEKIPNPKQLIQAYLEKSKQKLEVAQALLNLKSYDDSASRAYYAAFHAAQAALVTESLRAETHRGLLNLFSLHFINTGKIDKKFGKFLSNLKDDREHGDYDVYSFVDEETARHAVQEAHEFIKEIENFLKKYSD